MKNLSIYVHIPFCVRKCLYCDFLSFGAGEEKIREYFKALWREIELASLEHDSNQAVEDGYFVRSIFFGGGTPSFPDSKYICETLDHIKKNFNISPDAEITLEVNPASAMYDKLVDYRNAGFNRISIGAQSLNDEELKGIGRVHDSKMFFETFENARRAGFENINIDVMSALPDQKLESYMETLKKVVELRPEHISAYSLIVEEGTPFYDMDLNLPTEEEDRQMYHETKKYLAEHGYHRYEISNYALDGIEEEDAIHRDSRCTWEYDKYECYHNKVYWKRGNYLGLGLGASSMVNNVRWKNLEDIREYIEVVTGESSFCEEYTSLYANEVFKKLRQEVQKLSTNDCMEEFMFLGLRLVSGVNTLEFLNEFGRNIREVYGSVIDKYIKMGLLEESGDNLRLSDKGLDVSNTVMADFLL